MDDQHTLQLLYKTVSPVIHILVFLIISTLASIIFLIKKKHVDEKFILTVALFGIVGAPAIFHLSDVVRTDVNSIENLTVHQYGIRQFGSIEKFNEYLKDLNDKSQKCFEETGNLCMHLYHDGGMKMIQASPSIIRDSAYLSIFSGILNLIKIFYSAFIGIVGSILFSMYLGKRITIN